MEDEEYDRDSSYEMSGNEKVKGFLRHSKRIEVLTKELV